MDRVAPEYTFSPAPQSRQGGQARRLLASAQQKLRADDDAGAEADARAALRADGKSAEAHTLLGLIATRKGQADAAGRHYAAAAELAPANAIMLGNYGAWLCGNERSEDSLAWFERALGVPGDRSAGLANYGACALMAGRTDLAERASRAALDVDPGNALALNTLAQHYYASGQYFEARAFSQRRLAAAPATPDALRLASQIEDKLGDTVAATRYVQRLRTEFPQARTAGPGEAESQ
ncbi:tetratricopeptide repeat protein [Luteimonas aestuarii]|uniref:Tetratricopeptide repeat protein n=2 Tax=Luteimonas aestuarii TaxID=453837 RepID=A0A4R5TM72_9GAMM|nr:tetratricopeptide repeat protein [Luteimonas aestuarii]